VIELVKIVHEESREIRDSGLGFWGSGARH
jgi:hypothetical protein